ncbi:hypothetical protein GOP47_0010809 [Adiantum capillus-veneris]|uniref:Uncharacterized protein n=1 Tax=Adiantum capillus-veneris TaxID=13818 RepID=A0A9D4UVM6_ADICA|nr:hypothetical protein GOP47_0010809 [Adiantum capillus-veneris]
MMLCPSRDYVKLFSSKHSITTVSSMLFPMHAKGALPRLTASLPAMHPPPSVKSNLALILRNCLPLATALSLKLSLKHSFANPCLLLLLIFCVNTFHIAGVRLPTP